MTQYRLAPFLAAIGNPTHAEVAAVMGVTKETVHAWAIRGLGPFLADRLAVTYGLHPYCVWPSWFDDGLAVPTPRNLTRLCARRGCGQRFEKTHPRRRFCSTRCKNLVSSKKWKRQNKAVTREYRRSYYAECRDYELAQQRARDKARRGPGDDGTVAA